MLLSLCITSQSVILKKEKSNKDYLENYIYIKAMYCPNRYLSQNLFLINVILKRDGETVRIGNTGLNGFAKFFGLQDSEKYTVTLSGIYIETKTYEVSLNQLNSICCKIVEPKSKKISNNYIYKEEKTNLKIDYKEPDLEVNDDGGDVEFTDIQSAVDQANDGDIIWVYHGTYTEDIKIFNKDITLIGKNYEKYDLDNILDKPIIKNIYHMHETDVALNIQNSTVTISNFNIWSYDIGIYLENSHNCEISYTNNYVVSDVIGTVAIILFESSNNMIINNNFYKTYIGIVSQFSTKNTFYNNYFYRNEYGMHISFSSNNNTISENSFFESNFAVLVGKSNNNEITKNLIQNDDSGIYLLKSSNNILSSNKIRYCSCGIFLECSSDSNLIIKNTVNNSSYGIYLSPEDNNKENNIYQNNLYDNQKNAFDNGENTWYSPLKKKGNYWGDYEELYPDAEKNLLKGTWRTPYDINGNNQDMYPLINQVKKTKTKNQYVNIFEDFHTIYKLINLLFQTMFQM